LKGIIQNLYFNKQDVIDDLQTFDGSAIIEEVRGTDHFISTDKGRNDLFKHLREIFDIGAINIPLQMLQSGDKIIKKSSSLRGALNMGRLNALAIPSHIRQTSAPVSALQSSTRTAWLGQDDLSEYRKLIAQIVPLLLVDVPQDNLTKKPTKTTFQRLSPLSGLSNLSPLSAARSAPVTLTKSKSASDLMDSMSAMGFQEFDSEELKNRSLVSVIGTGMRNHMPRLLGILNDINGRMLYEKYRVDEHFYSPHSEVDTDSKDDSDSDDDDVSADDYVQPAFRRNGPSLTGSPRQSRSSSALLLHDSVPLTNSSHPNLREQRNTAWSVLNKLPLHLALRTYHERLAAPLNFNPRFLIKDDIMECIDQVAIMTGVIGMLVGTSKARIAKSGLGLTGHDGVMPLQFDVVIFPKAVVKNPNHPNVRDDKHDKGRPQTESQKSQKLKRRRSRPVTPILDLKARKMRHQTDNIGDVSTRLKALGKEYYDHLVVDPKLESDLAVAVDKKGDFDSTNRRMQSFVKNISFIKNGARHGRYVCIVDRGGTLKEQANTRKRSQSDARASDGIARAEQYTMESKEETAAKSVKSVKSGKSGKSEADRKRPSFPRRQTTVMKLETIPLPEEQEDDEKLSGSGPETMEYDHHEEIKEKDLFYYYQPPKPYGDIIQGVAMEEAMHSDTLEYLLPAIEGEDCPIGARHLCGGKMMCVSFRMMSSDEIKCYLYIDQKCIRLNLKYGQPLTDLMRILPHYFEDENFRPLSYEKALREEGFSEEDIQEIEEWLDDEVQESGGREDEREERIEAELMKVKWEKNYDAQDKGPWEKLSPLGEHLEEWGWDKDKLIKMYRALSNLYKFPIRDTALSVGSKTGKTRTFSYFSTVDPAYDELRDKIRTSN